jgi:predicted lipoprotein with Yx(FWY)xxD motif
VARRILAAIALLSLVLLPAAAALAQDAAGGPFSVTNHATLGNILADTNGMTLYAWAGDAAGSNMSACSDACATAWPPYLVAEDMARSLMMSTRAGAIEGTHQVTLDGWPLYHFVRDTAPGDANGDGMNAFGARWSVVKADDMMM